MISESKLKRNLGRVVRDLDLNPDDLEFYGQDKAKVSFSAVSNVLPNSKLT